MLHCVVFGTLIVVVDQPELGRSGAEVSASRVALSAVRYEVLEGDLPGAGATPCGAK